MAVKAVGATGSSFGVASTGRAFGVYYRPTGDAVEICSPTSAEVCTRVRAIAYATLQSFEERARLHTTRSAWLSAP